MGAGNKESEPAPGRREPLSEWQATDAQLIRGMFLEEAHEHLRRISEAQHVLASEGAATGGTAASETIDGLFRHLHTLKGAAGSVGFGTIADKAHDLEELCADIRAGTLAVTPGILDCIDEGVAGLRALLEGASAAPGRTRPQLAADSSAEADGSAGRPPGMERRLRPDRRGGGDRTVRVESERLDAILDGVGELVILRTRIERRVRELEGVLRDLDVTRTGMRMALGALGQHSPAPAFAADATTSGLLDRMSELEVEFTDAVSHLDRATKALNGETESLRRTTHNLDEELRRARLVPLDWMFQRLAVALRELERVANRQAVLLVRGGEIELDKSVVEQIADPLLHLLRNAMAHGIESEELRRARGKSARGRIEISARQEGEVVFITFEDDGNGIDRDQIQQALVRTGRAAADAPVGEAALLSAIFEPGFSSRAHADALAGRGMGLNVVKKSLVRLGGDVTVEYKPGAFSRFRLSVPLTAAITEALLFKVGGQVYAVPAVHVVEVLPLGPDDLVVRDRKGESVALAGAGGGVPILRLQSLLGVEMPPGRRAAALHIRYGGRGFIATCDKIIGPRTIVVRPLGPLLGLLPLYAGVTVSGSGKAQLVLDVGALGEAAHAPTRQAWPPARRGQPRILVVDDSRLSRETACRVLIAAGYHPVSVEDGWEAWEVLNERRFDAVVTDLEMPRVDGFELIGRIRREPTLRGLPIIVLSSRTSKATRDRATEAGANVVLPKSPNKRVLTDTLVALLGPAGEREQRAAD